MKKLFQSFVIVLVVSFSLSTFLVPRVVAEEPIYIRADGTVEGTDKIQRDGNVYTFAGDIFDSIIVEKDDIVIDGSGYSLQGSGSGTGMSLTSRSRVTIKNIEIKAFSNGISLNSSSNNKIIISRNNITNNRHGIWFWLASNNTISGNLVTNNDYGIYLESSSNNNIHDNNVTSNNYGIFLFDVHTNVLRNNRMENNNCNFNIVADFGNDIDASNTVDGKPIYYWVEEQDKTVPSDAGYVALTRCTNITVQNLNLTNNGQGILLASTTDSTIAKNIITNNNGWGIHLRGSSNNIISENIITNNNGGIYIQGTYPTYSSNTKIYGNSITNNDYGISIFQSSNNVLRNNRMIGNERNFVIGDLDLSFYINDIDASNTVNGKPIYYWVNERDKIVPSDAGYVALVNCTNITVQNLELANEVQGVLMFYTTNSTITKNNLTNNGRGVYLYRSSNNIISGNYITNNEHGIWLYGSSNNSIVGNYITNNRDGTSIISSPFMAASPNNLIYHNSYVNNTRQIYITKGFAIPDSINFWDNGVEGNYWSDYFGVDNNGDGIGDIPYSIDGNNQDNYPLMNNRIPPPETTPPTISIVSPENKTYTVNNVSLTFTVSELTSWMGYSLDGQTTNTIAGNTTLTGLSDGMHSLTIYAKDIFGNMGSSPMVHFTVDTPPSVSLLSPGNKNYDTTDITLTFTVNQPTSWNGYSLDGQANVTIAGNTTLSGLSDGTHSLTVYASDLFGNIGSSDTVYFTIDTALPSISILSPENKTYDTTDVPLSFTIDETVSWIAYSLDSQANVTITGNTTLTGLSDGSHSLTVYAKDTAGNTGTSETIYFSIAQKSEPFPITWIVVTIAIIAIGGAALLVYFAKVKKTTGKAK